MAHTHGTGGEDEGGGWRLLVALALNLVIVVAQVVGGVLSGSLAVLSDAAHNASDASALGISYFARQLAKRGADSRRTFGYARVETVAALVNLTTLVVIGLYLGGQAVFRLFRPEEVDGTVMLIVGDQEEARREVSVRERTPEGHRERKGVDFADLLGELQERYRTRT